MKVPGWWVPVPTTSSNQTPVFHGKNWLACPPFISFRKVWTEHKVPFSLSCLSRSAVSTPVSVRNAGLAASKLQSGSLQSSTYSLGIYEQNQYNWSSRCLKYNLSLNPKCCQEYLNIFIIFQE